MKVFDGLAITDRLERGSILIEAGGQQSPGFIHQSLAQHGIHACLDPHAQIIGTAQEAEGSPRRLVFGGVPGAWGRRAGELLRKGLAREPEDLDRTNHTPPVLSIDGVIGFGIAPTQFVEQPFGGCFLELDAQLG